MRALIEAATQPNFPAQIHMVLSDQPHAPGLEYAQAHDIETKTLPYNSFQNRQAFENALNETLRSAKTDLICLAGFMRLLSQDFVTLWNNQILNIHPSLLPAFRGLHTHERVLDSGVRISGCTVHLVRPKMDEGPILAQTAVPVSLDDTPSTLADRILKEEHTLYPRTLSLFASGKILVTGERVSYRNSEGNPEKTLNPSEESCASITSPPLSYSGKEEPAPTRDSVPENN